jgi:hypothetical protein
MAKPPPRRAANSKARANKKAPPAAPMAKRRAVPKARPKAKLPTLGGGLVGLGGTGAQGMLP